MRLDTYKDEARRRAEEARETQKDRRPSSPVHMPGAVVGPPAADPWQLGEKAHIELCSQIVDLEHQITAHRRDQVQFQALVDQGLAEYARALRDKKALVLELERRVNALHALKT